MLHLHRRAPDRAKGAEHATVARLRSKQRFALLAYVEELAGVGWHSLLLAVAAVWACQHGVEEWPRVVHLRCVTFLHDLSDEHQRNSNICSAPLQQEFRDRSAGRLPIRRCIQQDGNAINLLSSLLDMLRCYFVAGVRALDVVPVTLSYGLLKGLFRYLQFSLSLRKHQAGAPGFRAGCRSNSFLCQRDHSDRIWMPATCVVSRLRGGWSVTSHEVNSWVACAALSSSRPWPLEACFGRAVDYEDMGFLSLRP
jgi:hypothetical protein